MTNPTTLDRLPPHSNEAEQGVLGCLLLDPNALIGEFIERVKAGSQIYYDLRHVTIQETLTAMFESRQPIDLITVQQHLKERGMLEQVGGIAYLSQLQDSVPSAANFSYYLDIVFDKATIRKLISTCSAVVGKVFDHEGTVDELLEQVEQDIMKVRPMVRNTKTIKSLMQDAINLVEQRSQNWDLVTGYSTGLSDLDKLTDGIHGGEFIVIGAPTSCGKTALALNIIVHNALKGVPSGMLSAEMQPVKLALRSLCAESRVNFKRIDEHGVGRMIGAAKLITNSPIHLDSINGFSIGQVRALARRMKQQHGIKILAVENIQLLEGNGKNREQEIANVSRGLKGMALELDIAVLGLSQLNDEGRLRESRAIGHDADSAWILSNDGEWQPLVQPVKLTVEKCRDGETGKIDLIFRKEFTRFESASRFEDGNKPTRNQTND